MCALGILAYEMLAGRPPFQGKHAQATLSAQILALPYGTSLQCIDVSGLAVVAKR